MAQGLEPSRLETTCCVCASVEVPHKERRRVSRALAFTVLGQKLNEISQISLKLPGSAIVIVCKRCSDLIAKVEKLETELDATKGKIVQLIGRLTNVSLPRSTLAAARCCSDFRFVYPSVCAAVLRHLSSISGFIDCSKD